MIERRSYALIVFLAFGMLCQLALLLPSLGGLRVILRSAAFGSSLALLMLLPRRGTPHPAASAGLLVMVLVGIAVFHPTSNTLAAAAAQFALYVAILAPLYWVTRIPIRLPDLRAALMVLLLFHFCSAAIGILQVRYPGFWQPNLSTIIAGQGEWYVETLKITTSTGARVFRPMGLTDIPGGAGTGGLYAAILGIGFLLTSRTLLRGGLALGCILVGLTCLYLSQVRVMLVITSIALLTSIVLLILRGNASRATIAGASVALLAAVGYRAALSLGGEAVINRVGTLTTFAPGAVYYNNRGMQLEYAVQNLLPQYPWGAGLGRWGMTNLYFGDNTNPLTSDLWAELQWTAWLLDGGIPLILAYSAALAIALYVGLRLLMRKRGDERDNELALWAIVILSYDVGMLALMFGYPLFVSQTGMEFWLLNAALFTASLPAAALLKQREAV